MKAMGVLLMKMAVLLEGNALRHVENHDMESFFFEKRSLVDFQIRREPYIAHGLGRGKKEREIGGEG